MTVPKAVITLRSGQQVAINCTPDDLDTITRFVDDWQAGKQGAVTFNSSGRGDANARFEYRDVLRVDFPEATA